MGAIVLHGYGGGSQVTRGLGPYFFCLVPIPISPTHDLTPPTNRAGSRLCAVPNTPPLVYDPPLGSWTPLGATWGFFPKVSHTKPQGRGVI